MYDEIFMAIPPGAIIPGALPKFKIFFLSPEGHYVLWALEGNKVTSEQLDKLTEGGLKEVFIDLEENIMYEEYLETNLGKILENEVTSVEHKAEIFGKVSTNLVRAAFDESFGSGTLGPSIIQRTEEMIKNALIFITESKSLQQLAQMIGHDYKTYEHATKVLWYTMLFLKDNPYVLEIVQPGYQVFNELQQNEILKQCGVGALLHDIGKVFISQDILNKSGPLTEIEWEIMKRHPLSSLAMLLTTDLPEFVKKGVLQHHEDFDGGGYPMGQRGFHINMLARVMRIVDTFDAMTSRRPYKDPLPPKRAMDIMVGKPTDKKKEADSVNDARDRGMLHCFDEDLLRKFILFLGKSKLDE